MRLPGNPGAITATMGDLSNVIGALGTDKGDMDSTARSLTSPGHWTADGATAFATAVISVDDDIDRLGSACEGAGGALSWYAGELSSLQATADRLNQAAAANHLTIDDDGNVSYTGPPVVQAAGAAPPWAAAQQQLAIEARQLVADAKRIAEAAKKQLDDARMSMSRYDVAPPWATPWSTGINAYVAYTSAADTYSLLKRRLDPLQAQRDYLAGKLDRASSPSKMRHWDKELRRFERDFGNDLTTTEDAVDSAGRWAGRLPFSKPLSLSLGDLGGDSAILGSRALRNVPVAGIVLTAGQAAWNIHDGAEPTEEVGADTASLVAGSVAADLAVTGIVALGVAGAAPIIVGLAVGVVVAWGVGEGVHAFFHTELGHEVAHDVDQAVGTAVHAVGDAAHSVGDAASGAWHSLFG